jgi:RNA polymerase sigma factor (sigma-70 family)
VDTLIGRNLGGYKIVQRIGAGGMGVVYRARDLDLDRDVAVKFLSGELASRPQRLALFRSEAKSLASLNHPNIASIYRIVKTKREGPFLVLELIDGITLAARLQQGSVPMSDALDWCSQVADALEAAHQRGVIHRDLKPGNIMITTPGRVKVLDFGLARRDRKGDPVDVSATTISGLFPDFAQAAGTPGYASPEQILGQEQDARVDVFAFGCVLYECLTGDRAFRGTSKTDALAATLGSTADLSALPASAAPSIRELIESCLEKNAGARLHDMGTVKRRIAEARTGSQSVGSAARASSTPHNLPSTLTTFVGRKTEIAACRERLAQSQLLTLVGPGGCGKTRLALRVALDALDDHPDGVWFVDLAPVSDPSRVSQAVATAMRMQGEPGVPVLDVIASRASGHSTLIVLDNCEHLLAACAETARALAACGAGVRVLATSRERLGLPAEDVFGLSPLEAPPATFEGGVETVARFDAVRLFVDRARQVADAFALDAETAGTVVQICRKLEGMPLAIELAAARIRVLGVAQILTKLDQRFRLLTGGSSEHGRQQTLEATIRWSYDLLDTDEQRLLRHLAVFAGGWSLEAAVHLSGEGADEFEVLDSLARLVDKSLVTVEHLKGEARYSMLETVRQYAQARLAESRENDAARNRHLEFYLSLAERSAQEVSGRERSAWFLRLDRDFENTLLALEWAQQCDPEITARLVQAVSRHWISRGFLELGLTATRRALQGLTAESTSTSRAVLLVLEGEYNYRMGRHEAALEPAGRGLQIAREIGDKKAAERALWIMGNASYPVGRVEAARGYLQEALTLAREIGEPFRLCSQLNNVADLLRAQRELDAAVPYFEEALAIVRTLGEQENTAVVLGNMAQLFIARGDEARGDMLRARSNLIEMLAIWEETSSEMVGHILLDSATGLAARVGDVEQAARLYGATEAKMQRAGAGRPHPDSLCVGPLVAEARERLGAAEFARAEAEGHALGMEGAVSETGRCLERWLSDRPVPPGDGTALHAPIAKTPPESTAHLLARVRRGDIAATNGLVKRYLPVLRRWAHGRLPMQARDLVDTDDLVQVTLVRALGKVESFEPRREGAFLAYLRKTLLNQIRDELRRVTRAPKRESLTSDVLDRAPSPLEATVARGTFMEYEAALARLPEKQREALILRAELGFSYGEVAEAVGCASDDAARMLVSRGLNRVARLMRSKS